MHEDKKTKTGLSGLNTNQREKAMARFAVLKPHIDEQVPLSEVARDTNTPARTAQRWLSRYRHGGLAALARSTRSDAGHHKLPAGVVQLIEGMALRKPRLTIAAIHRKIVSISTSQKWSPPSYGTIYGIVRNLDPAMVTLAQDGHAAFRDQFELIYRHRADRPNAIWQADHTQLDILILDANGATVRPWLTTVIDDYSRSVAGFMIFLGAPSALQTSLALRQAIWRKTDPAWPVCGIPDMLYVDHGSDFTSTHLEQVAAELHFQLVYSSVGRPQGRGKVERLFGTLNTELLPELSGYLSEGKPSSPPGLSLPELDAAIGAFLIGTYNERKHSEIGDSPKKTWIGKGWLPRMPETLEDLDLLLVMVARSRTVRRDGIHFQGLRYMDPTLAAYVGEAVTIRYDPRDIAEIRVFHRNVFLCRAISPEYAGQTVTLKDIQTARIRHRKSLRAGINERIARVVDFLPTSEVSTSTPEKSKPAKSQISKKLHTYSEDKS
ncbi:MAG: DDE-type integrase/transposase/recombinase [Candidatus Competibacteraceae bacterium]|nr:DDE-type integrase/transposase/recombinase [Candidatus Competibacteraceae bacterium]